MAAALRPNDAAIQCLQILCSLAAPVYPLESLYGPGRRFDWISQHKMYTEWLGSRGPGILHVHGTTGASDASEYIFQCLDVYRTAKKNDDILVYFAFNRHDDRRNSVVAMLTTLLAQIIYQNQDFYDIAEASYELMSFHSSWTQIELSYLFRRILSMLDNSAILCVVNRMDECDSSLTAFLRDLCSFAGLNERRWKIAITSTTNSDLQAALTDCPAINLDDPPEDANVASTNLTVGIDFEVLELMQQRPEFCDFEETITEKLSKCGQDEHWRRLVLTQLIFSKSPSTKSAAQRELDLLPTTALKDTFARILAKVPSGRRAWARKALSWILYAFHPLSIWELGVALALEVDSLSDAKMDLAELVYQHVVADLDEVFGGMFIVKHNEVHFSHPDTREFLLAADGEQEHVWYDVKETAHQMITDACLFYLSLQQVQDSITISHNTPSTDPLESPIFIPRYNLHVYATNYWPRHYKLIPEIFCPTARVLEFVQNTKAMRCWTEAYWWFSNPISRTDRGFLSLLPIFAGLGLQDLVTTLLDLEDRTPNASQDRALAIAEAARNAHVEVVRKLLSYSGYNQANLQDALVVAVSCCDEAVVDQLVTYATGNIQDFEWPPAVLCRAAQFGLEKVVRKLLDSRASVDVTVTIHNRTPLHFATRQGHAGVVKALLDQKAILTALSIFGQVPLHFASLHGDATIVKLLLDAGADVDVRDDHKNNALCIACWEGNYKAVEILAEAGCDTSNQGGDSAPLHAVAAAGFIKSARFLLNKKVSTEGEARYNWTPLRPVALKGDVDFCRLLLENGADANTLREGEPILVECASQGNLEIMKLLVENGAAVDAVNSEGSTALQRASATGHISVVAYLLDHGADINHTGQSGATAILLAAESSFAELVQLLIDRGADLHRATTDGWAPINGSWNHAETTRVLLENGADPNRILNGVFPLFLAARNNQIEVVKVLLSFKPDLEIQSRDDDDPDANYTALIVATIEGHTDVVRLLLEAGANVNGKAGLNRGPLQHAMDYNKEDVVRILMEYRPDLGAVDDDGDTPLHCITSSTSLETVKLLLNGGSDLEIRNNRRDTPLCKAVMSENLDIVKYLIEKKAKLNIIGGHFGSPLHIACRWSNLELVKVLVAAGADVNLVDPGLAGTPIQSACLTWNLFDDEKEKRERESIIRFLINEAKADVTTVGGRYGCALNTACEWSTPEMVTLILEKDAKVDVEDRMGRVAVHFAAAKSLENFQKILDAGADVEVRDKMGRTALHWATIGGLIDVIERVLSLSRGNVDQADIDGWTPLLWGAMGCGTYTPATSYRQEEVIKLLLDRGADPCVRGKGLDGEWSPVKVARYHALDDAVIQLLMTKAKEKLAAKGEKDMWDEAFHTSKKAQKQKAFCDSCLLVGILMLAPLTLLIRHLSFETLLC